MINFMRKNEYPPEYCPLCGYNRSQDIEKHKCSQCVCHTPPQDFPLNFDIENLSKEKTELTPFSSVKNMS